MTVYDLLTVSDTQKQTGLCYHRCSQACCEIININGNESKNKPYEESHPQPLTDIYLVGAQSKK